MKSRKDLLTKLLEFNKYNYAALTCIYVEFGTLKDTSEIYMYIFLKFGVDELTIEFCRHIALAMIDAKLLDFRHE